MASPFSFHCMICIEEFDQQQRYPVVLPCGHTYVCNQCAERLMKCPECREPLFISENTSNTPPMLSYRPATGVPSDFSRRRTGATHRGGSPPSHLLSQQPKKRLPLPKNIVLMSLMEATEVVTAPQGANTSSTFTSPNSSPNRNAIQDEEEEEEEKIRLSTLLATSGCGTYVVTGKTGVQVYPSKPIEQDDSNRSSENEDVDAMVRFFYLDNKMSVLALDPDDSSIAELPSVRLAKGDRIQIVAIDDGWAKLARGYGYLRAETGQVAKVGGSVDRACKLEAILRSLTLRRKELRNEQRKVDSQFVTMMHDLQTSLLDDEDLTVIGADTFAQVDTKVRFEDSKIDYDREKKDPKLPAYRDDSDSKSMVALKTHRYERESSPPSIVPQSSFGCFPEGMFGDYGGGSSGSLNENQATSLGSTPIIAGMAGMMRAMSFSDDNSVTEANNRVLSQTSSHPSPRAMSTGARAWRERNNRPASRGIDFRTGMSGHMALLSTHAHASTYNAHSAPHGYLRTNTSMLGRMSAHTGLTSSKKQPLSPNSQKRDDVDDSRTI